MILPNSPAERKKYPVFSGVIRYFYAAILGIARVSYEGNRQHGNEGGLFHDRSKSDDELDAALRHLIESEFKDSADLPGVEIEDQVCWRVLAWSQKRKEQKGARVAPAAINVPKVIPHSLAADAPVTRCDHVPGLCVKGGMILPVAVKCDAPAPYDGHPFNPVSQAD